MFSIDQRLQRCFAKAVLARMGPLLVVSLNPAIDIGLQLIAQPLTPGQFIAIKEVASTWCRIQGEQTKLNSEMVDHGIHAVDCSSGWISISRSARGRDSLCIDLDPAQDGVQGQIIEYVVDSNERRLIAKSFADLLSLYFVQPQSGELALEDEGFS